MRAIRRRLAPDDELFLLGNLEHEAQRLHILTLNEILDDIEFNSIFEVSFKCPVSGCKSRFTSIALMEAHHHSVHENVCATCRRTYTTKRLLDLHLAENHDPIFTLLSARQPMYECPVDGCSNSKWATYEERARHLIIGHHYPRTFELCRARPNIGFSQFRDPGERRKPLVDGLGVSSSPRRRRRHHPRPKVPHQRPDEVHMTGADEEAPPSDQRTHENQDGEGDSSSSSSEGESDPASDGRRQVDEDEETMPIGEPLAREATPPLPPAPSPAVEALGRSLAALPTASAPSPVPATPPPPAPGSAVAPAAAAAGPAKPNAALQFLPRALSFRPQAAKRPAVKR
ncbi:putative Zinc finger protein [Paratrimastix pyriformis]|uniref:Zinc finger protein n=1 Tax=Paratrimastix pyriformis TaxID=342808 RepID=A0ABQ8UPU5_9EUKA|nr:putative Zinc finger protein [Paratrimastix pyriformis]